MRAPCKVTTGLDVSTGDMVRLNGELWARVVEKQRFACASKTFFRTRTTVGAEYSFEVIDSNLEDGSVVLEAVRR